MALNQRRAGILLHPTSLPGPFGIGDLGPQCIRFLDWVHEAGLTYWQILPLGPTGYGDSPYQCFSAFAGNPLLISPELLLTEELIGPHDLENYPQMWDNVDFGAVMEYKTTLLRAAFHRFKHAAHHHLADKLAAWKSQPSVRTWLPDYAVFRALKSENEDRNWTEWPEAERRYQSDAVNAARVRLQDQIEYEEFIQFLFFDQWNAIRAAAATRGIEIIGDAPIYVSFDSADTWANQEQFMLNDEGQPTYVAGVPPDYFSATGQLWGNPIYNWHEMENQGFAWWLARMASIFETVDIVRLDHFRGFMGYYMVPAEHQTAEFGKWQLGPGERFFTAVQQAFGNLPIIAEDLGEITEDVTAVRDQFGLPGMVILQFAWTPAQMYPLITDPNNHFLPHRHTPQLVVYTGTHDNDTTLGWWRNSSTAEERSAMQIYLATDGNLANWDLLRAGMQSVANTFIVPAQDLLNLDTDARMNMPGRPAGNWTWRLHDHALNAELAGKLHEYLLIYERCANPPAPAVADPPKLPPY